MLNKNMKAWVVCLCAALFFFYVFIQMNFLTAVGPKLFEKFHIGAGGMATLSSMYFYGNVLFLFPAGLILDRVSTKGILLTVTAISVIATLIFGFANHFYQAELARFVMGVVGAFCLLAPVRLASRWFPADKMALVVGVIVTMAMVGGMVAQNPFQLLVDHEGLRATIFVDVAVGIVIWLLMLVWVSDAPDLKAKESQIQHNHGGNTSLFKSIVAVVKVKQNWFAGIYASLVNLPVFLLGGFWGALYLTQMYGLSRTDAAFVNSMLFFGMIIGSPVYGWISDTLLKRRLPMMMGALFSLLVFSLIMFSVTSNFYLLTVLFFLFGFAISSQVIAYPLVVESNGLELTGTAEGLASVLIMSGGFLVNLFAWMLNYHSRVTVKGSVPVYSAASYHFAFSLMLLAFVLSFVFSLLIKETHCKMKQDA